MFLVRRDADQLNLSLIDDRVCEVVFAQRQGGIGSYKEYMVNKINRGDRLNLYEGGQNVSRALDDFRHEFFRFRMNSKSGTME
jgi:hypothetical protein